MPWSRLLSFDKLVSFAISSSLQSFIVSFSLVASDPGMSLELLHLALVVQMAFMYVIGLESLEPRGVFCIDGNSESEP